MLHKSTYNIHNLLIRCTTLSLFIFITANIKAQPLPINKYGLQIVNNTAQLKETIAKDSSMQMLSLTHYIPGIIIDLKYTSSHNFLNRPIYPTKTKNTFLRMPAAIALKQVQAELKDKGLSLKIWDAYRPYSATEKMWEPVRDERYAANPKYGSGHNRGIAVDITLVDIKTGKELNMGTGFDNFSDTAHTNYKNLSEEVLQNRETLRYVMEKYGFKVLETEWWHFYLPDSKKYALMDLSFKTLKKLWKQTSSK